MAKFSVDDIKSNAEYIKNLKRKREKALKKEISIRKDLIESKNNDMTTIKTGEEYEKDEEKIRQMYLKLGILEIPEKSEGAIWLDEAKKMEREKLINKAELDRINKILKGTNYLYIPYIAFQGYRAAVERESIFGDLKIELDKIIRTYIQNIDYLNIKPTYPTSRITENVLESGRYKQELNFLKEKKSIRDKMSSIKLTQNNVIKYKTDKDRVIEFNREFIKSNAIREKSTPNKELKKHEDIKPVVNTNRVIITHKVDSKALMDRLITMKKIKEKEVIRYKADKDRNKPIKRDISKETSEDNTDIKQLEEREEKFGYILDKNRSNPKIRDLLLDTSTDDIDTSELSDDDHEEFMIRVDRSRKIDFTGHNLPHTYVNEFNRNIIEMDKDFDGNKSNTSKYKLNRRLKIPKNIERNIPVDKYNEKSLEEEKFDIKPGNANEYRDEIKAEDLKISPIVIEEYNKKEFIPEEDKLIYKNNRNRPLKLGLVKLNNYVGVDEIVEKEKLKDKKDQELLKSEYRKRVRDRKHELKELEEKNIVNKKDPIQRSIREHKTSSFVRKSSNNSDSSDGAGDGDEDFNEDLESSEQIDEKIEENDIKSEEKVELTTDCEENITKENKINSEINESDSKDDLDINEFSLKEEDLNEETEKILIKKPKDIDNKRESANSKASFKPITDFSTLGERKAGDLMSELNFNDEDLDFEFDIEEDDVNDIIEKSKNEGIEDISINTMSIEDVLGYKEVKDENSVDSVKLDGSEIVSIDEILLSDGGKEEDHVEKFDIKDHLEEDLNTKNYHDIIKDAEKKSEEELNSILNEVDLDEGKEYDLDRMTGSSEEKVTSLIDKIRQDVSEKIEDEFEIPNFNDLEDEEYQILDIAEKNLNKISENINGIEENETKIKNKPVTVQETEEINEQKIEKPIVKNKLVEEIKETKKVDIIPDQVEEVHYVHIDKDKFDLEDDKSDLNADEIDVMLKDLNEIADSYPEEVRKDSEINKKSSKTEIDKLYSNIKSILGKENEVNVPKEYEKLMDDLVDRMKKDGLVLKYNKNKSMIVNSPGIEVPDILNNHTSEEITLTCDDLLEGSPINFDDESGVDTIEELITGLENINRVSKEMPEDVIEFTKIRQTLDNMLENEWEITLGKRFNFVPSIKVTEKLNSMGLIVEELNHNSSIVFFEKLDPEYTRRRQDYYDFMKDLKSAIVKLSKTAMIQRVELVNRDEVPKVTNEELELMKKYLSNYELGQDDKYLTIDLNIKNYR